MNTMIERNDGGDKRKINIYNDNNLSLFEQ